MIAYSFNQPWPIIFTLAITALTATWWITEAIPIPVTALVPVILFPVFGILDQKIAASAFGHPVVVLLIGAFMLSKAVESCGVDKRIALGLIQLLGKDKPKRILLALMISAALMSMWVSNVATALMLFPIVMAIAKNQPDPKLSTALLLGIAYAASVGGMGTPIGTPSNLVFSSVYQSYFGQEIGFLQWMQIALPIVVIAIPLMAIWLGRGLTSNTQIQLPKAGQWQSAEKRVLIVFVLVAMAWVFRQEPFGGWSGLLGLHNIGDSSIALIGALALFLIPTGNAYDTDKKSSQKLLDWQTAVKIPWGVLFLVAGGICIARAFKASGLSELLGSYLSHLTLWPTFLMIAIICFAVTFLTEITSNTATTTLLMPILAVVGSAAGIDAKLLMIPAAMSASCAFMLPAATAPNAVIYGSEQFSIKTMAREGFVLNLLLASLISLLTYWLI